MYNHHGNQAYCNDAGCDPLRGQPIFESYNNTGTCAATNCEFMSMRGGSNIIHDETFKASGTPWTIVKFDEEDGLVPVKPVERPRKTPFPEGLPRKAVSVLEADRMCGECCRAKKALGYEVCELWECSDGPRSVERRSSSSFFGLGCKKRWPLSTPRGRRFWISARCRRPLIASGSS
jgi:hypothetical protein